MPHQIESINEDINYQKELTGSLGVVKRIILFDQMGFDSKFRLAEEIARNPEDS